MVHKVKGKVLFSADIEHAGKVTPTKPVSLPSYDVSGLPAASSNIGAMAYVTSGSDKYIGFSNGSDWPSTKGVVRYVVSAGNCFPYTHVDSTSNVRNNVKVRELAGTAKSYENFRFTYVNFIVSNGAETDGGVTFDLNMGVRDAAGVWHQGYCNGQTTVTMAPGAVAVFDVPGLTGVSGDKLMEVARVVGPSGTQSYPLSHGVVAYRGEGVLGGTDNTVDLTMGGTGATRVGFGGVITPNMSGGAVNTVTVNDGGSNWGNTGSIFFITKDSGGSGANYAASVSGGVITSGFKNAGGSGFNQAPDVYAYGGGYTPGEALIYAAAIMSASTVDKSIPVSLIIWGDSIARGFGSSDGFGNIKGLFGMYEKAINNAYGVLNCGVPSMASTSYVHAKQDAAIAASGVKFNNALIEFALNDFFGGGLYSTIADKNKVHADFLRSTYGCKIAFATLAPGTTGTWTGTASSNQTAMTGCGAGSPRETYNTKVRDGSDSRLVGDYPCFDLAGPLYDLTTNWAWRGDLGYALTTDGIHPSGWVSGSSPKSGTTYNFLSASKGIDYAVANGTIPTLTP